ncbi:hypothetical protein KR032_000617 [Drosophila birchii]|nr:hypothetical protein KR032_000617 [Drosophila birchii]
MQTDEPAAAAEAATIARNTNGGWMANCYYANKLHGGYFTEPKGVERTL